MSEKRFVLCQDDLGNYEIRYDDKVFHFLWEVAPILNEQQSTINELKEEMVRLHKMSIELMDRVIPNLRRENEQLRRMINPSKNLNKSSSAKKPKVVRW